MIRSALTAVYVQLPNLAAFFVLAFTAWAHLAPHAEEAFMH